MYIAQQGPKNDSCGEIFLLHKTIKNLQPAMKSGTSPICIVNYIHILYTVHIKKVLALHCLVGALCRRRKDLPLHEVASSFSLVIEGSLVGASLS